MCLGSDNQRSLVQVSGKGIFVLGIVFFVFGVVVREIAVFNQHNHLQQYDIKIYFGEFLIFYGLFFLLIGAIAYYAAKYRNKGES